MVSEHQKHMAEQARREGCAVFSLDDGPVMLGPLLELVKTLFPNHSLDQIAITQAEYDKFVIAAMLGIQTTPN